MHFWFEWKISQGADTNVDQSECGMIDADVTAAFCAIPAVADFAALESPEELRAIRCAASKTNSTKITSLKVVRPNLLKFALIARANDAGWTEEVL